jgi:hypothetical protein
VVQLLLQHSADADQQHAVLLDALDDLLTRKQAAAVGLLLHVLQGRGMSRSCCQRCLGHRS